MFDVDNMLGASWPGGRSDIGIHAEGTHWTDPNNPAHSVPDAGALFVYAAWDPGETPTSAAPFLKPDPVVLYTPVITVSGVVVHQPSNNGRMGRGAAPVVWRRQTLTGSEEVRGLLVGEPDAPVRDPGDPSYPHTPEIEHAGRVFFFRAPLDGPNGTKNAWGDFVLIEPIDSLPEGAGVPGPTAFPMQNSHLRPNAFARFGAWIVSGRYNDNFPGSQFVVSARNRDLPVANDAGRAYSFHLPAVGP